MQNRNLIRKLSLLVWLCLSANVTAAYGQSSGCAPPLVKPQDNNQKVLVDIEFLKAAEIAIADRDRLKVVSEGQAEALMAKDQQIAALRGLLQLEKQISTDWKEAATARKDALKTDDKLILTYDKRIAELQAERDASRRANKLWGFAGVVLGVLATIAIKGSN